MQIFSTKAASMPVVFVDLFISFSFRYAGRFASRPGFVNIG